MGCSYTLYCNLWHKAFSHYERPTRVEIYTGPTRVEFLKFQHGSLSLRFHTTQPNTGIYSTRVMFRPVYCAIISHYTRDHAFNTDIPHTTLRRVMPTADFSSCSAANNASLILAKTLAFLVVPSSWLCIAPSAQIDNIAVTFSSLQVGLFSRCFRAHFESTRYQYHYQSFLLHEVHEDF